jgi:hypothetical protein
MAVVVQTKHRRCDWDISDARPVGVGFVLGVTEECQDGMIPRRRRPFLLHLAAVISGVEALVITGFWRAACSGWWGDRIIYLVQRF